MGKNTGEMKPDTSHALEEMQREIRTTEAEISETLHSIEAKLAPSHLKEEVKGRLLRGTATAIVRLGYAIKSKPASAAAIGAGALMMMVRRARKRHPLRRETDEVPVTQLAAAAVKAMPKEAKRHPAKTAKRYVSLGRMAFAFVSTVSAVLLRGKRAQHALERSRYRDYTHHVGGY